MKLRLYTPLLAIAAVLACWALGAVAAPGSSPCDLVAAPNGSDSAAGTIGAPFRSAETLVDSLQSGQVGCFRSGDYSFDELKLETPGIALTSFPGERAVLHGRIWIAEGSDGDTVSHLDLDGRSDNADLPSPTVNADDATFIDLDVTNFHTGICFVLGNTVFGRATGTTIEESRIHDCGRLPSENQDHGIYLSAASDTTIRNNWIYDNADRGIQLYPDAQNTTITGNVIYGNGEGIIFSGNDEVAASGSTVTHNVIAGARIRRNVESFYPEGAPTGVNNVVQSNCTFGASSSYYAGSDSSGVQQPQVGFSASKNVTAAPVFVNAAAGDFRLVSGNACAAVLTATSDGQIPGLPGAQGATEPSPPPVPEPEPEAEPEEEETESAPADPSPGSNPAPATTVPVPSTTPAPPSATVRPSSAPRRVASKPVRRHVRHGRFVLLVGRAIATAKAGLP